MDENLTKVILALLALLAVGLVIKVAIKFIFKSKNQSTKTTQKNNIVFGDQAGRDINKK